jgi:uncharacterized membrane protein YjgN (DUF898 family)
MSVALIVVLGIVIHLFMDWIVQNDWMAKNKGNLKHSAGWVHAFSFAPLFLFIFPWYVVIGLCISHALIDTRKFLLWWFRVSKKSNEFWLLIVCDQVLHIVLITLAALIFCR